MLMLIFMSKSMKVYSSFNAALLCVSFLTFIPKRSQQWQSEESLFVSGLSVCPTNAKVHLFPHPLLLVFYEPDSPTQRGRTVWPVR